jgi:hypothetical protein
MSVCFGVLDFVLWRSTLKRWSTNGVIFSNGVACKPSAKCRWGMQVDASALCVGAGVGVSERERRKEETRMR